jgi:hypothetical protein
MRQASDHDAIPNLSAAELTETQAGEKQILAPNGIRGEKSGVQNAILISGERLADVQRNTRAF